MHCRTPSSLPASDMSQHHLQLGLVTYRSSSQSAACSITPAQSRWLRVPFGGANVKQRSCWTSRLALKCRLSNRAASSSRRTILAASASEETDVVVVGAGLAGLAAGLALTKAGVPFVLLEASDGVGGRVRTDELDGFLLDRGFQIFLTSYPEAQAVLDYDALQLAPFYAGASVFFDGAFHRVADPFRHPADGVGSLFNPVGSVFDKVNVGLFRLKSLRGGTYDALFREETSTLQRLQAEGFSQAIIDRFFRPFLGGIFFDSDLGTTSRLFEFVMRMLATGANCLPAAGIGAVAEQLAARLEPGAVRTGAKVEAVSGVGSGGGHAVVLLAGGGAIAARRGVVVAVEGPEARRLLGDALSGQPSASQPGVGTANLYFRAPKPPTPENILYLNGTGRGLVNNACSPSTVAPSYAPAGQALISVSTLGTQDQLSDEQLAEAVKQELGAWFGGAAVAAWQLLRIYRIPFAQPNQAPPSNLQREVRLGQRLYVCGDHRNTATFDGALLSGRRAVEALLADTP